MFTFYAQIFFNFFLNIYFYFMCMCGFDSMYVHEPGLCCIPLEPEEDVRSPGTRVKVSCEPPCGCSEPNTVLCKSSKSP